MQYLFKRNFLSGVLEDFGLSQLYYTIPRSEGYNVQRLDDCIITCISGTHSRVLDCIIRETDVLSFEPLNADCSSDNCNVFFDSSFKPFPSRRERHVVSAASYSAPIR